MNEIAFKTKQTATTYEINSSKLYMKSNSYTVSSNIFSETDFEKYAGKFMLLLNSVCYARAETITANVNPKTNCYDFSFAVPAEEGTIAELLIFESEELEKVETTLQNAELKQLYDRARAKAEAKLKEQQEKH